MTAYSSIKVDSVWIREVENGMRHVTLRKDFEEIEVSKDEDGPVEKQYKFEETDIYIVDRDNVEDYINSNFDFLFSHGVQEISEKQSIEEKRQQAQQIIKDGSIVDSLQQMGQQITDIILGV